MNSYEEQDYSSEKLSVGVWKKVFKILFTNKKTLIEMLIAVVVLASLDIIVPLLNSSAIKHFFEDGRTDQIFLYIIAYAGIALGYAFSIYGFIKKASILEVDTAYELRKQAFKRLQELPFAYYDKTASGWIMARLTSDARRLSEILSWGLVDILWGCLTMFAIIIILLVINPLLALIIVVLTPILLSVALFFRKKILKSYRDVRKINSKITASYNEGLLGAKTTKTLVLEEYKGKEFTEVATNMKRSVIRAVTISALLWPSVLFLGYIGVVATIFEGVVLGIAVEVLYLFITYTTQFFDPVLQISHTFSELQQAQASAERIIALIETEPEIKDTDEVIEKYGTMFEPKKENWEKLVGDVEFKDVSFRYVEKETVLDNFNLSVKAGQSVALVGTTGSGKSTIVNLICRFYEPTSGKILIDGKDYKERSISWLHSNLGYVLQTPQLFKGTILENVRYGKKDATDEEVINACKIVKADEFIEKLDDKYNSDVGESGNKLSLGQRQLISFARAIVANPSILILDEATSSIDTKTEYDIQSVINVLMKGRTTFVVAHRLSTIINADIILVIKDGKILEKGNHKELLSLKGEYYNLYRNQFIVEKTEESKY